MKSKRFLIIVFISIIFICIFCNDIIEGIDDDTTPPGGDTVHEHLNARALEIEIVRCGEEDTKYLEDLKKCYELSDPEVLQCISDMDVDATENCMDNCWIPVLIGRHRLSTDQFGEEDDINIIRPAIDDLISTCQSPISEETSRGRTDEREEIFGVDCLKNCEIYFHGCQFNQEVTNVDGESVTVETYDNLAECPNGLIPEQNCNDVDWGCRKCKSGYHIGDDDLCKPNLKIGTVILYVILTIIIGGLLIFIFLIIKEMIQSPKKSYKYRY